MTAITENKVEAPLHQEKVDTNSTQNQNDTILTQKQSEQKIENGHKDEVQEDPNWKAFREARKKDRLEREAAEKRASEKEAEVQALKAAMEAAFSNKSTNSSSFGNNPSSSNYQEEEESEDQKIEKKVLAALAKREQEAERQRIIREQQEYPTRLKQNFPDFDQTISTENLDYLEYHYPEVAAPLKRLQEGYDKWHDIYKAVKKFIPNTNVKRDAARAETNFSKPKSISSTGVTQTGEAKSIAVLSEERKAANWARMQAQLKGVG